MMNIFKLLVVSLGLSLINIGHVNAQNDYHSEVLRTVPDYYLEVLMPGNARDNAESVSDKQKETKKKKVKVNKKKYFLDDEEDFNFDNGIILAPIGEDGLEINRQAIPEPEAEAVAETVEKETSTEPLEEETVAETVIDFSDEMAINPIENNVESCKEEAFMVNEEVEPEQIDKEKTIQEASIIITADDIKKILPDIIKKKKKNTEFKVALMLPLYLEHVDEEFVNSQPSQKALLAKPFSFIHFYDGFMIAADSVVKSRGMSLNLKIYDVDQDITKANNAAHDSWLADADLIIGPFFAKPFEKMRQYATEHDIMIVNPVTPRSSFTYGCQNVIKIKPANNSQIDYLAQLIRNSYYDCNVFIFSMNDKADSDYISKIQRVARENIHPTTKVSNKHIYNVIKRHHNKLKINDVPYSEDEYFTSNKKLDIQYIKSHRDDSTLFENKVFVYSYATDSLKKMKNFVSNVHRNLVIVYGDDKVFASEMVNKLTKLTEDSEIVMVAMPEWSKFKGLFNENLMKTNTVYFGDYFINYHDYSIMKFICKYRKSYGTDPVEYSYLGFNIGWYFLNFMHEYGLDFQEKLSEYRIPLLGTDFEFHRENATDGFENVYWNIYQFKDYENIKIETNY